MNEQTPKEKPRLTPDPAPADRPANPGRGDGAQGALCAHTQAAAKRSAGHDLEARATFGSSLTSQRPERWPYFSRMKTNH